MPSSLIEITNINSLAQTGIGINLAFAMIRSFRTVFVGSFLKNLEIKSKAVRVALSDFSSECTSDRFDSEMSGIFDEYDRDSSTSEYIHLSVCFYAAFLLMTGLFTSALLSPMKVYWVWLLIILLLAITPAVSSAITQVILFRRAIAGIEECEKRYMSAIELLGSSMLTSNIGKVSVKPLKPKSPSTKSSGIEQPTSPSTKSSGIEPPTEPLL